MCNRRRVLRTRRANPARHLLWTARGRAKRLGLPFNLVESDIIIPTHCPALGIPLEPGGGQEEIDNSPSLDRLRPELGYTKGNVIVISHLANSIKHNASASQVSKVAEWMRSMGL